MFPILSAFVLVRDFILVCDCGVKVNGINSHFCGLPAPHRIPVCRKCVIRTVVSPPREGGPLIFGRFGCKLNGQSSLSVTSAFVVGKRFSTPSHLNYFICPKIEGFATAWLAEKQQRHSLWECPNCMKTANCRYLRLLSSYFYYTTSVNRVKYLFNHFGLFRSFHNPEERTTATRAFAFANRRTILKRCVLCIQNVLLALALDTISLFSFHCVLGLVARCAVNT